MMTEPNTPGWPESFLHGWPGRFQHAELVRRLYGDGRDDDLTRCLLDGISAARTADEVLAEFAERGEFQLVETLLAESGAVSDRARARWADLEPLRADRMNELTSSLRVLTDEAAAAGVTFDVDVSDLEALARLSWPTVDAVLTEHRTRIHADIDALRDELVARNRSSAGDPRLRAAVESLIASGRLTLARRMVDGGTSHLLVPEAQPELPPWRWNEPVTEVVGWHIGSGPRPPEFSAWRAVGKAAQDLVDAAEALGGGGREAATDFAVALERFLDPDAPEPVIHEIKDGWLSTVTLFRQPPLSSFRAAAGVPLAILPPGVQSAPMLPGVDNYLAVGPDLQVSGGFRTDAALLTMIDILRLVTLPAGRAIGLARIVGKQWPLSALGAGTPAGLARLLAQDPEHPWHLLGWLCNLAGVGGSAAAEDLQFQSGDDAPVLYTLLMNRVDAVSATADGGTVGASPFRERGSLGVEAVVLRDCPDAASRAAFWATLVAAPPGTLLSLDSVVVAAALSPSGDDIDWESVLVGAFDRLREQWFMAETDRNDVSLRPLGVLAGLRGLAERRLAECAQELSVPIADATAGQQGIPLAWSVHRYALSENWDDHQQMAEEPDLTTDPDMLIEAAARLSGSCDLAEVAGSLVALARRSFPAAEFIVEIPARTAVAVPERVLLTVLYEVLENALEATERAGKILLSGRAQDSDVIVDIFDDGLGVDSTISRTAQVFRPGFSTRGEGRGTGLYLVRRITDTVNGELEVADRSDGHPVFKGAHFTLILPGGS